MEAGFLNFHDEEHFSDLSLSLDHQHDLSGESHNAVERMVDNDFDYIEGLDLDSNDDPWETEQELNGDLAVLPVSGVAGVYPKIENIKEDFAKVLDDWQEHIGYLQSTELEEDIDMVNLDMGLGNVVDNSYADQSTRSNDVSDSAESSKESSQHSNYVLVNPVECNSKRINRFSESDLSEKEIGNKTANIKEECLDDDMVIKEPLDTRDDMLVVNPTAMENSEFSISSKRKDLKKSKKEDLNKKIHKKKKTDMKIVEKSKMESKALIEESSSGSSGTVLSYKKAPALEAGDVKSLLEQFEATEAASIAPRLPEMTQMSKIPCKKHSTNSDVNTCQTTWSRHDSQDSKLHQDIRDSLPKQVIDRIEASGRKRVISVIPAMPNNKTWKNNGTRMQEAAATLDRNKLLKLVTTSGISNSNARLDGSVQLDHDYCSSSSSSSSSSSNANSLSSSTVSGNACSEYSRTNGAPASSVKPWLDNGSKKDSGLESGEASDASEEQQAAATPSRPATATPAAAPLLENKIQSALAASILQQQQQRRGKPQMVSVLKRQLPAAQKMAGSHLVESIVTTTNSSNGQVQNIIVQESSELRSPEAERDEQQQQPARRKLNLAEYRSRRFEQTRSDGSRTSSPVQPMALVYVHHASTSCEPIACEREIVSVLKPKSELEEEKLRPKAPTEDKATQTAQSVFGLYTGEACCSIPAVKEAPVTAPPSESAGLDAATPRHDRASVGCSTDGLEAKRQSRKSRNYRRARASSSSSASRSRSRRRACGGARRAGRRRSHSRSRIRSRSRSRSRTRGRRSRTRSRSRSVASRRARRYTRRRRISHRRSSVSSSSSSSSSSWSSSSRSSSRSRSRARPRSRSRSGGRSRSRSRSKSNSSPRYRSSSRSSRSCSYSSYSRSPSRSENERVERRSRRHGIRRDRDANHDRYRGHPSSRGYTTDYRRELYDEWYVKEKQRQVEERRVVYVGRLEDGVTKAELRKRFETFGPVVDISVHFREHGHNYGFVTFSYKDDAYQAVEHGNDDPSLPRYDLCFGGRRAFCKVKYADLDGAADESMDENRPTVYKKKQEENTFDLLLKEAQEKLRKRKV